MNKKGWVVTLVIITMALGWITYCNTGVRRASFEIEILIEEQCRTFAECRINEDSDGVNCWAIDTNDEVEMWSTDREMPTWGDIDKFCTHLEIVRQLI